LRSGRFTGVLNKNTVARTKSNILTPQNFGLAMPLLSNLMLQKLLELDLPSTKCLQLKQKTASKLKLSLS